MAATPEIKYRGPLTLEQLSRVETHLFRRGRLLSRGSEKTFFFDTSIFPRVGDFATGFSRISLKQDRRGITLRIKEGNPSNAHRKERAITIHPKETPNLVFLFEALGLCQGYYRPAYRKLFVLGPVKVSLKTNSAIGDHFELELSSEADLELSQVKELFQRGGLWCWTPSEYQLQIYEGIRRFPAIPLTDSFFENQGSV